MNVTPEMLLFLAGKVGVADATAYDGWDGKDIIVLPGGHEFNPATDDAQFGRLVVWACQNGVWLNFSDLCVCCIAPESVPHNSTPDGIRAAAVVAICRALGFQEARDA